MEYELMLHQMGQYRRKELKNQLKDERFKNNALHDLLDRVILENNELKRRFT